LAFFRLIAAGCDHGAAVGGNRLLDILGEHGKRGFRVRADGDVHRLIALEILIIGADVKIAHADC